MERAALLLPIRIISNYPAVTIPSMQDIDWGSLDVFTCSASCDAQGGAGAYAEELVLIQPPVYLNK